MPGLIIDKVGGGGSYIAPLRATSFFELQTLIDNNKLVPGSEYLFTDYLHKYFIEGSDSAGKKTFYSIIDNQANWGVLGGYHYELLVGTEVIITELPEGYAGAIQVGDTTTVSQQSSYYYFNFANGLQWVIGAKFITAKDRYINIANDTVVNDANGRPVIRPGGIINTEVHDGAAYMEMSAAENHAVVPEQLILTADSSNSFAVRAKSVTYPGDEVDFYFDSNEIYNDNKELIGARNGFIYRRINEAWGIDLNLDWRVQRYRRWALNLDSRTKFLNQNLDPNTTRIGYQGKFLFTSSLRVKEDLSYFYIGMLPEGTLLTLDENAMQTNFLYEVEGIAIAKDYTVFPLDADLNPGNDVGQCEIGYCYNTVFQALPGSSGNYINVKAATVFNSTFISAFDVDDRAVGYLENVIALDKFLMMGLGLEFANCQLLSLTKTVGSTGSTFEYCVFGTMQNGVRIDGYTLLPVAWWLYITATNSYSRETVYSGVLPYLYIENTRVIKSSFFFYHSFNDPDVPDDGTYRREVIKLSSGIFSNVGLRITGICDRIFLSDMIFSDSNPDKVNGLYLYDFNTSLSNKILRKYDTNDQLYFETKSPEGTTVTTSAADGTGTAAPSVSFVSDYRIKDAVLAQVDWVLNGVSGLYEYSFVHALITLSTEVEIVPDNDSLAEVIAAQISPYTATSEGSVMIYAETQPAQDIVVNILISKVQDV